MAQTLGSILGNQIIDQFPINNWAQPQMTYGLTYLPPSYASGSKTYPLIIHLEGLGEIGTGIAGLSNLLGTSLPQRISQGLQPSAVNPIDGQTYEFIVVSPQGATSALPWLYLQYILANIISRYRIDTTRIYVTGYSSGGWATWTCVTDSLAFCEQLAAVVPVSAQPVEAIANVNGVNIPRAANIVNAAAANIGVWNICGSADGFIADAQQYTAEINATKPKIPALLTTLQGVGHSAWNQAYDPTWVEPISKLNFYQWLLQYKLGVTAGNNVTPPPPVTITYLSTAASASFSRNNCPTGNTTSPVIYTVPGGKYTSTVSQAAADAQAQAEIAANGQNFANSNGVCVSPKVYSNVVASGSFTRNNCLDNYTPSAPVVYTVPAGKYTSTISQADADSKAQADITTNGQNNANTTGTCTPNLLTTIQVYADGSIKQV